ncbi:MAG: winged helix DNA-binding protein [Gemmiger sp.]|nr:winged helix DNA-binding protein [Gemmiger sp.]
MMPQVSEFILAGQRTRKLLERACEEKLPTYGLRRVEWEILYYLACIQAGDTARQILHDRHFSKAHISKSVENLRTGGYITLDEDDDDRRCLHLRPTAAGRAAAGAYKAVREQVFAQAFAGVTEAEWACTCGVLAKLNANLNRALG